MADTDFHICFLKRSISTAEGRINLGLNIFRLVNQVHEFTNEDIPFLIHQVKPLPGKGQGIFCQYEISLSGKGIRIRNITPFPCVFLLFFCWMIIFIQNLGINTIQFFSWNHT